MGSGAGKTISIPVVFADSNSKLTIASLKTSTKQKLTVQEPFHKLKQNYQTIPLNVIRNNENDNVQVVHGIVGLKNLGNTCYFNSAIHCLSHTQPLLDYILSRIYEKEINRNSKLGSKGDVTTLFAQLLEDIWKDERCVGISKQMTQTLDLQKRQKQYQNFVDPLKLLKLIQKYSKRFEIGQQEDCQELLSYLLDIIHEDLNRCQKKDQIKENDYTGDNIKKEWAAESWMEHLKFNKSIIVDLFQGQLKSNVRCNHCGYQSHKWEPFLFLNLPIASKKQQDQNEKQKNKITQQQQKKLDQEDECQIQDCLNLFQKDEKIQWICPKCKENRECTKGIRIWKLPNILIIHLKRFDCGQHGLQKINTKINFPIENLDLTQYCDEQNNPTYNLYAVAQHYGSLQFGHYVAICKNRNDFSWYMYNDDAVYKIQDTKSQIVTEQAYVLFYQRKTDEIYRQTISNPASWPHNLKTQPNDLCDTTSRQNNYKIQQNDQQCTKPPSKMQTLTIMDYEETEQRGHLDESPKDNGEPFAVKFCQKKQSIREPVVIREPTSQSQNSSIYRKSRKIVDVKSSNDTTITKIEQDWGFAQDHKQIIQMEIDKQTQKKFVEMQTKKARK